MVWNHPGDFGKELNRCFHFDRYFVGIREDYVVEVRTDILDESDGPMLIHGLQKIHGIKLIVPRSTELRPNSEFLHIRYERFRAAI